MLKIDRTTPPSGNLAIEEDEKEYQQNEVDHGELFGVGFWLH